MRQSGKKVTNSAKTFFALAGPRRVQVCNLNPDFDKIKALCH